MTDRELYEMLYGKLNPGEDVRTIGDGHGGLLFYVVKEENNDRD